MKTNQNMVRKMGDFQVIQRTKDGMFNATGLLKQWNQNPDNPKRALDDFWKLKNLDEFLEVLIEEENLDTVNLPYVKSRASRGINAGTWMHPVLFIKFAMWINPRFEYYVVKFVADQLIEHRHLAGDYYKNLCARLSEFGNIDYAEVGRILNYVIFNNHKSAIRNEATPEQENDLQQLERDMCQYIDMGFVNDYEQFKSVMRTEWKKRHGEVPVALQA